MRTPSLQSLVLAAIGALFAIGFIGFSLANPTGWDNASPKDESYNQLVEGFQKGQLSLNKEAPAGFKALANPYDPAANARYRYPPDELQNLSYYRGKLYIYFGVTPALVLFWPWAALTGAYLFHREAVAIFCSVGFLASLGLLRGLWRRYFPEAGLPLIAVLAVGLGLLTGSPIVLQRGDLAEVPAACGYALAMLALGGVWLALHDEAKRPGWLAAASLAMGLAVGARPTLLFGGAILLVPVLWAPGKGVPWKLLLAAVGPMILCGLGLALYNQVRFSNPLDFGQLTQLAVDDHRAIPQFSIRYLWFNFCVDFLEPVRWSRVFPYVGKIATPPAPAYHGAVEDAFGVLPNLPALGWALAAPLAWRLRAAESARPLRGFLLAAALLFAGPALTLCLYYWDAGRYELDFLPALAVLGVVGILGAERALAARPGWRLASRLAWGLALTFSAAFVALDTIGHYAEERGQVGIILQMTGRSAEAIPQFEAAMRAGLVSPEIDNFLGNAMLQLHQDPKATAYYEDALRLDPNFAAAHYNFANLLAREGRFQEAEAQYRATLRLKPDDPDIHENLAAVLAKLGKTADTESEHREAQWLRSERRSRP